MSDQEKNAIETIEEGDGSETHPFSGFYRHRLTEALTKYLEYVEDRDLCRVSVKREANARFFYCKFDFGGTIAKVYIDKTDLNRSYIDIVLSTPSSRTNYDEEMIKSLKKAIIDFYIKK